MLKTSIWAVVVQDTPQMYHCSYPVMLKKGQCKHSLGLKILERGIEVPLEAKTIPLGQKRKRGRAAKARGALQRQ